MVLGSSCARLEIIGKIKLADQQCGLAGPIYVHFDTDVVALHESPAHNYPAPGGPSASVMQAVFHRLAQSGQVVAVSLSAWNPELDQDKRSADVSVALLRTLVG